MQFQRPALIQRQELRMTPQLLQSIQIMTLPLQDLQTRIQEELEANPALRMVSEKPTVSLDHNEPEPSNEYFENSSDPGFTDSRFGSDSYTTTTRWDDDGGDGKRMFIEGAIARPESLHDHLVWQLRLHPISDEEFAVGELLILNLNGDGFHLEDPMTLVAGDRHATVTRMMELVRGCEPVGCCVADYRESLVEQARRLPGGAPAGLEAIIADHLPAVERGRTKDIARAIHLSVEDVEKAIDILRTLNPFPGRMYAGAVSRYVIPDLLLRRRDGQFVLVANDEEVPVLGVDSVFARTADSDNREARKFASAQVRDARWFINSVRQRTDTILKVGRAIVEFQRDFFLKGKKYLLPLTLREIAAEVGVSEATVSRATSGKYLQTEWGIFELKHFFSNSIASTGSGRYSKEGVKETIREMLEDEATAALSDQKIADLLAQRGITLARRTVAKYRKELKIESSYGR